MTEPLEEQPFFSHFAALRRLVLRSAIVVFVAFLLAVGFAKNLYTWLALPLEKALAGSGSAARFVALSPMEAWVVYFKLAFIAGIFIASPFIFWELWRFLAPALYRKERRSMLFFIAFSVLCFAGGAAFAYFIAFPMMFTYLLSIFVDTSISFWPSMSAYFSFTSSLLLAFGLIFELPVVLFLLVLWDIVELESLTAFRKYFIVAAFVVAAILTPPDPVSQISLGLPFILLYELSLLGIRLSRRLGSRRPRPESL